MQVSSQNKMRITDKTLSICSSEKLLKELLQEKITELSNDACRESGKISKTQIEEVEALVRLVEFCEKRKPKPKRNRWGVIAILIMTVVIVSGLFFYKVQKTEIELELMLTNLNFVLSKNASLTEAMIVSELGILDVGSVQLPDGNTFHEPGMVVWLGTPQETFSQSSITLTEFSLPAGTRIALESTKLPKQYRMSLELPKDTEFTLQVDAEGTINMERIGNFGSNFQEYSYMFPQPIYLTPATNRITVDFSLRGDDVMTLSSHLPVEGLSFLKTKPIMGDASQNIRHFSTVFSGILYLTELSDREPILLRAGEDLRFKGSHGLIRVLKLEKEHISLQFHGNISDMITGWGEGRKNLMPNLLEWLNAHHSLTLLWGTIIYLFVFFWGIWKWWINVG